MEISASLHHTGLQQDVRLTTNGMTKTVDMPPKPDGNGSAVNGGELLFLALATCCCNDIYREAGKRKLAVQSVTVTVNGEFGAEGEPGRQIRYAVAIEAACTEEEKQDLIAYVDQVAEVHNTLRVGTPVTRVIKP